MPLVPVLLLGAALLTEAAPPVADRIFVNARVWTGDSVSPRAAALAVAGDRFLAVGTRAEALRFQGPRTEVVDLRGHFVAPGFNDAHLHFLVLETVDLADVWSVAEVQKRIREYAESHTKLPWVVGRGWSYGAFPGGLPHRRFLDEAVPDRPAWMTGYDGHTGWANSRALALAGITRATPDPEHGVIVRDEAGEATGVLKEAAMALVSRHVPAPTGGERYDALLKRFEQAASYGLTSVQNASFVASELPLFERAMAEGRMTVRLYWALPFAKDPSSSELARYRALRERYKGPLLKFGAVKGFVDGVVESKTAAMFEPYARARGAEGVQGGGGAAKSAPQLPPSQEDAEQGELNWSDDDLFRTAALYDREGFQIFLHAIGDRAIDQALDAFANAAAANRTSGRRHRVEHIEVPRAEDIPRFKALGVIASTQPLFASPDQNTLQVYAPTLGPDRASRAMAFRSLDEAGAVQAFGSDWPVFSMETLKGIYCAVTRLTPEGTPPGGWNPRERIPAEAALRHFTVDAAYASFDEQEKGTLGAGKLADFVVLSEDILTLPPERILRTRVLRTVMGGRDTFRAPEQ